MDYDRLEGEAAKREAGLLDGWQLRQDGKAISRRFEFKTFIEAFGFMTECAMRAEKLSHHPDWSNNYGRVDVVLTTHATGGLTAHDFKLARAMDKAYLRRN